MRVVFSTTSRLRAGRDVEEARPTLGSPCVRKEAEMFASLAKHGCPYETFALN